jgi:peptidoglycan/xylan/chitin deacetylase (PgdA/CDA1 family)
MNGFSRTAFWVVVLGAVCSAPLLSRSEIVQWQDGKAACVSLTFDDGSVNQFRIAMPLMDERGFAGTFFINTRNLAGSKYPPAFVGRPIMEILKESASVPAGPSTILERASMLRYLREIQGVAAIKDYDPIRAGELLEQGKIAEACRLADRACRNLRDSGQPFALRPTAFDPGDDYRITWDELRRCAARGHEFADHTISHPYLSAMDEANIRYETEKCREDIREQLGPRHTLSIECPFGIEDERVLRLVFPTFPFVRNRANDDCIDGILRSDPRRPGPTSKAYIQWQRGALSETPYPLMISWIATTVRTRAWLVLVIHGVEGIGWEPLTKATLERYFDYIKAREPELWVATFQDAYKYIRERVLGTVKEVRGTGRISVRLSHTLDRGTYDLPLTLRTSVPTSWLKVKMEQGGDVRILHAQGAGGGKTVMYRAVPNGPEIRLTSAAAGPPAN